MVIRVYFVPGWDHLQASNILMFETAAEAHECIEQRDRTIHMGEAMETATDIHTYRSRVMQMATDWTRHRLTPTQQSILPGTTTFPTPTMEQRTIARAYNDMLGTGRGRNNNTFIPAAALPPNEQGVYTTATLFVTAAHNS